MPVITPAYPAMCVTHTITSSSKAVIQKELARGAEMADEIVAGKQTWKCLFEKHTFFTQDYGHYLGIVAATRTQDEQLKWSGLVRAKVHKLVFELSVADTGVKLARLYPKGFDRTHRCKNEEDVYKVFQGNVQFQFNEEKVIERDESKDESAARTSMGDEQKSMTVYTTTYYIGLELDRTRST